jgi:hypothetical protein
MMDNAALFDPVRLGSLIADGPAGAVSRSVTDDPARASVC